MCIFFFFWKNYHRECGDEVKTRDERVSSGVKGEVWKTVLRIAEVLTGSDNQRAELGVGVGSRG